MIVRQPDTSVIDNFIISEISVLEFKIGKKTCDLESSLKYFKKQIETMLWKY